MASDKYAALPVDVPAGNADVIHPCAPMSSESQQIIQQECLSEEEEMQFWHANLTAIAILGASAWASMPITFGLAWLGFQSALYIFLFVKFVIVNGVQVIIQQKIAMWLRKHKPLSPQVAWLQQADERWWPVKPSMREAAMAIVMHMTSFARGFLRFVETVDPDMDAMTPGNARQALTDEQAEEFSNSWHDVPIAGFVVANLGLPGTLGVGILVISLFQASLFVQQVYRARTRMTRYGGHEWWTPYGVMMHVPDISGLLLLGSFFRGLHVAQPGKEKQGDRAVSYKARACEAVFQTWFTVTVLGLVWGGPASAVWPIIISIATSYVAMVVSTYEILPFVNGLTRFYGIFAIWPAIMFYAVGFTIITARIVAIWTCSSHRLQLSRFRCAP